MRIYTIAFSVLAVFLFSCHRNNSPSGDSLNTKQNAIEGSRWNIQRLSGLSNIPEIGSTVYIRLDSGKVAGFAGCNNLFGAYTISGDTLQFNPVGSTKKFCNTGMDTESYLLQSLTLTNRYELKDRSMKLLRNDSILAEFIRDQP